MSDPGDLIRDCAELQAISASLADPSIPPALKVELGNRQYQLGRAVQRQRDREDASPVKGCYWQR